jgi:hypothetical protein
LGVASTWNISRPKSLGVIASGPRAPEPGAPIAWVTTARFLEIFALGSLCDLPDLDALDALGAIGAGGEIGDETEAALDDVLGIVEVDGTERLVSNDQEVGGVCILACKRMRHTSLIHRVSVVTLSSIELYYKPSASMRVAIVFAT